MQQVLGTHLWVGQGDEVVPAGKFQPLSILSSNKTVRINLVPDSVFSLHSPGIVFQEKMHLCAYKMSPLRIILSAEKKTLSMRSLQCCLSDRQISRQMLLLGCNSRCSLCINFICDLQHGVKRDGSICNQHFAAMPIRTIYKNCIWQFPPEQLQNLQPASEDASDRLETEAQA